MKETDYINPADGLLYCGKCNTRKQCKVSIFGRTDVQYCLCECEKVQLAVEETERKRQQAIADKRRRENISRTKNQMVDLNLTLDNGTRGHIKGSISSRK